MDRGREREEGVERGRGRGGERGNISRILYDIYNIVEGGYVG